MRLGDIATVITKGTTPTSLGFDFVPKGINFIKIESIAEDGSFIPSKFGHIDSKCNNALKRSQLEENDILFSIAGAIGRTAIVTKDILPANTNQALAIIRMPEGFFDYSYLLYVLQSPNLIKQIEKKKQGVAQLNISLKDISDFVVPDISIEEQKKIASNLSKVGELISCRKEQLAKLDELVKARFVEMFGDPVCNEKGWNTKPLLEMGSCKNGMNFHYDDAGVDINCLGVGDFKDYSIISDTSVLPTVSLNETPSDDYMLKDEDIVFVRSNGNKTLVGRSVAIYPGKVPTTFSGFCIRYRKTDETVNISYLLRVLKTESIRKKMAGRGANIQNLNQQILGTLIIPIPPLNLQNQFAAFVEQTEKTKAEVQKSLDELEILKKSLMQKYFG